MYSISYLNKHKDEHIYIEYIYHSFDHLLDHLIQKSNVTKVNRPLVLTELTEELTTNGLLIYHVAIAYVC